MSHQTKENVLFISGIDTNVGKTVATGMIAKALAKAGKKVITQKMIQTGCEHVSEDIEAHRQIQGIPFTDEDFRFFLPIPGFRARSVWQDPTFVALCFRVVRH